ncbi:MAG: hypothetical protein F6K30_01365 [Cyanothece sp. SIO2G6]|nr:hypothetical protein [Cyanothece sp. SIO2G6]
MSLIANSDRPSNPEARSAIASPSRSPLQSRSDKSDRLPSVVSPLQP